MKKIKKKKLKKQYGNENNISNQENENNISNQENLDTQEINSKNYNENEELEEIKDELSSEDEVEVNCSLLEPKLFKIYENELENVEEIKESISEDENEDEKYLIKTINEFSEKSDENCYYLAFNLELDDFLKMIDFRKINNFQSFNRFIDSALKVTINFEKDWYITLYGNICLKKHCKNGFYLNEKLCFYVNENSNYLLNIPVSCKPNCVLDFVEYQNKKYICLKLIKDIKKGEYLKLKSKKQKYCLDLHDEENDEMECLIFLKSKKISYIKNFLKNCKFIDDDLHFTWNFQNKNEISGEEFEKLVKGSKKLKSLGYLAQCFVVHKALSNTHNYFHKRYGGKDNRFSGKKNSFYIKCFPCILKLKEIYEVDIESGFEDIKSYANFLEECENEKQQNKEMKKTSSGRINAKKEVKKKYSSSVAQFEKLNKYFKEMFNCAEAFITLNDQFNFHVEKEIWSDCAQKSQKIFSNFLIDVESSDEDTKETIFSKITKLGCELNSIFELPESTGENNENSEIQSTDENNENSEIKNENRHNEDDDNEQDENSENHQNETEDDEENGNEKFNSYFKQ